MWGTSILGTPVHECSHALFCILFGHRITSFKPFAPNRKTGEMGHVTHTYDSGSIYQRIGNFFIGVAPITVGIAILVTATYFLLPSIFESIVAIQSAEFTLSTFLESVKNVGLQFFQIANFTDYKWWIFFAIIVVLSLHMDLSDADVKGSFFGLVFLLLLYLVVTLAMYLFFKPSLDLVVASLFHFAIMISSFFLLCIAVDLVLIVVSFILALIFRLR